MKTIIRIPQGAHRSLLPSFRRGWAWLLFLMASVLLTSCRDYYDETATEQQNTEDMAMLRINVYSPSMNSTRADEELIADESEAEGKIWDVRIYAFPNGTNPNDVAIGYIVDNNVGGAMAYTDVMGLPKSAVNQNLDFYIMANVSKLNSESINNLEYAPTRDAVETATFDAFGTTRPVNSVPAQQGLPASQLLKNVRPVLSLEGSNELKGIKLTRAVSKFRFFFANTTGNNGASITKIVIYSDDNVAAAGQGNTLLPASEYIMPKEGSTDKTKLTDAINIPTPATPVSGVITYNTGFTINQVEDPEEYKRTSSQLFTEYESLLMTDLTSSCLTYIRESGKPIKGKIWYKTSETATESVSQEFIIKADIETAGHNTAVFPRNHYSVVYAYFQGGGLYVEPQVQPWQWGGELNFFSKTTLQLNVDDQYNLYEEGGEEKKFKYLMYSPDEDGNGEPDYNNWDNNYCAIANGFDGARPKYAPWLVLNTTSMSILQLQTDNTNFGFIIAEKTSSENTYTYSSILDEVNIPAGKNVKTYFYVVPKGDFNLANPPSRFVNVTLIERNTTGTDEISVHRLPWNSILPGSQSHETAQFYYVTGTEYQQNIDGTVSTLSKQ